jgi:hypothetical protein
MQIWKARIDLPGNQVRRWQQTLEKSPAIQGQGGSPKPGLGAYSNRAGSIDHRPESIYELCADV